MLSLNDNSAAPNQAESVASVRWSLVGTGDGETSREYSIHSFPFSVGRHPQSNMHIPEGCISKKHAEFTSDGTRLFVNDLGSTNGTFVNGTEITGQAQLSNGDVVQFATLVFRVQEVDTHTQMNTIQHNASDEALALMQFDRLINENGLYPHYQPIILMTDQSSIGYEVLGRSKLFGLQSPFEMFRAASKLNMETKLSESFRTCGVELGKALGSEANLFLNTHPKELEAPQELFNSLIEMRKMAPEQTITLEIHERAVTNLKMMKELCAVLKDLNIFLAFDDFGAGRTRLLELSEICPEYVKFDMELTRNIEIASPKRQEVVSMLATMVNNLGIKTLAEGVETGANHQTLVDMGFVLGQGYYYGRPSPISKFIGEPEVINR